MKYRLFPLAMTCLLGAACSSTASNNGVNNTDALCEAHLEEDDAAGAACDSSADCVEVACPCNDGSIVDAVSCSQGSCEGRDECADACRAFGLRYPCAESVDDAATNNSALLCDRDSTGC